MSLESVTIRFLLNLTSDILKNMQARSKIRIDSNRSHCYFGNLKKKRDYFYFSNLRVSKVGKNTTFCVILCFLVRIVV